MGHTGETSSRQVIAVLPRALLAYVRRAVGEAAAGEVLLDAGLDPQDPRLSANDQWVSGREAVAIADAAAALCGDPQVGRRTGEEHFRSHIDSGIVDFLRAESDPAAAITLSANFSNRMGAGRRCYQVRETGARQIVVEYTHSDHPIDQHWFWCQIAAGYWSQIPSLFGAVGTVVEPYCAARGDDHCELVVCWDLETHLDDDSQVETEKRAERVVGRFEDLQSMAAEMATADDVPTVLERIVQRVSLAIMAPRFVLTVRRHENAAREVFAVGLTEAEAHQASDALWAGREHPELGVPLVVPVASDREEHGYLAAFLTHGASVSEVDQRLLSAYAGHATAALERVVAIEAARRDHRATSTLLDLAHDLASARSIPEIADRVTAAVPEVIGCELAGVWLLDADAESCRLQSVTDTWDQRGSVVFPAAGLAELARSGEHAQPFAIDRSTATDRIAQLLTEWGVDQVFLAPITHRGELQGLLAAAAPATDPNIDQDLVLKYLSAIANHASTAIGSATLLAQVRHQALHDALTGLPNRPQIEQRVQDELWHAARTSRSVALAFVDLDRFKKVNDTLGHAAGDELIRMAAARLEDSVRGGDVVARLGGDEFLVMVPLSSGPGDAVVVAEKILCALRQPFSINGESLFISASVGIACYPAHGTDYSMLLAHADAAMYEAKSRGRNTYAIHAQDLTVEARRRLKLENDLHRAVARDQLRLRYQPQVDLVTGDVVGVEALVRWAHPTMGELEPAQFLTIAEESGLIVDIDRWVRREAFSQAKRWSAAGTPVRVAVNLSTRDLHNPMIAEEIGGLLTELELDPHLVELEVTDRVVMAEGQLPEWLSDLISLGASLAIDDFGTGNSVLSRLQRFPMDTMKIDRSFIEPLDDTNADPRLVRALISMAHALDMQVVSEGVETVTQADLLRELGSDLVQGFLFHRPMPAEQLTELLAPPVPASL